MLKTVWFSNFVHKFKKCSGISKKKVQPLPNLFTYSKNVHVIKFYSKIEKNLFSKFIHKFKENSANFIQCLCFIFFVHNFEKGSFFQKKCSSFRNLFANFLKCFNFQKMFMFSKKCLSFKNVDVVIFFGISKFVPVLKIVRKFHYFTFSNFSGISSKKAKTRKK